MRSRTLGSLALAALTVAGLAVDAYVHFDLAPIEPPPGAGQISESVLFYVEASVAILSVVLLLATGSRWTFGVAGFVAATGLGAVLLYRFIDVGALGPLPDMYEPVWYPEKLAAAIAEATALVSAATGFLIVPARARHRVPTA